MAGFPCFYYLTESNRSPVEEFINSLDDRTQRKFFFARSLLEEFGSKLPYPHAKYIGNSIFELRFRGQQGAVRILYFFFQGNKIMFTNGFIKKSSRIPKNEVIMAIKRRKGFLNRQRGDGV